MWNTIVSALIICAVIGLARVAGAEADRNKLLSDPGVYGTFASFHIDGEWGRLDQATRLAHLKSFKGVVERHREKLAIDRGDSHSKGCRLVGAASRSAFGHDAGAYGGGATLSQNREAQTVPFDRTR